MPETTATTNKEVIEAAIISYDNEITVLHRLFNSEIVGGSIIACCRFRDGSDDSVIQILLKNKICNCYLKLKRENVTKQN